MALEVYTIETALETAREAMLEDSSSEVLSSQYYVRIFCQVTKASKIR